MIAELIKKILYFDVFENNPKWRRYCKWHISIFFGFLATDSIAHDGLLNPARVWKGLSKCFQMVPVEFGKNTRWWN
jgi:hypothetical protein